MGRAVALLVARYGFIVAPQTPLSPARDTESREPPRTLTADAPLQSRMARPSNHVSPMREGLPPAAEGKGQIPRARRKEKNLKRSKKQFCGVKVLAQMGTDISGGPEQHAHHPRRKAWGPPSSLSGRGEEQHCIRGRIVDRVSMRRVCKAGQARCIDDSMTTAIMLKVALDFVIRGRWRIVESSQVAQMGWLNTPSSADKPAPLHGLQSPACCCSGRRSFPLDQGAQTAG